MRCKEAKVETSRRMVVRKRDIFITKGKVTGGVDIVKK